MQIFLVVCRSYRFMSLSATRGELLAVLVFVFVVGSLLPAALPASAQSSYEISAHDAIDVPERDVTVDGSEFTISEVAQFATGSDIQVHVSAPDGETYDVNLYNYKSQDVDRRTTTGSSDVSFPTDDIQPGTFYVAVIQSDYRDVYPVVVKGYDVGLEAPASVEQGEAAEVSVPVTATASSGDPHEVQVVVGDELRRIDATKSDGTYTASISTGDLSAGEYPVYGVVRGEEETEDGRKVILGLSDRQTLTVTEQTATETGSTGGTGGDGAGGGNGGSAPAETASPTPTTTTTPASNDTTTTSTDTPTPTATERTIETTRSPTATPTPTEDEVITPATATTSPTPTSSSTPSGGQPGFGVLVTLVAALGLLAIRRR